MLAGAIAYCFSKNFCFRFSISLKVIKRAMSKVRTIVCCSKYYQNDIRHWAKAAPREALVSDNFWLCLWFSSICYCETSQNFHNLWNVSRRSFKSRNFPCYELWIFLSTGTRKGENMLNGPANLRKFHQRKCSKAPYFLWRKTVRIAIELRQDLYLSMRSRYFVFGWLLFQAQKVSKCYGCSCRKP